MSFQRITYAAAARESDPYPWFDMPDIKLHADARRRNTFFIKDLRRILWDEASK